MERIFLIFLGIFLTIFLLASVTMQNQSIMGFGIKNLENQESILTYIQLEPEYLKVGPGKEIVLGVTLIKLNGEGKKDVTLEVFLKNHNGSRRLILSETIALETRSSMIIAPKIPKELEGFEEQSSINLEFEVKDSQTNELLSRANQRIILSDDIYISISQKSILYLSIIGILILIGIIIIILMRRNAQKKHRKSI